MLERIRALSRFQNKKYLKGKKAEVRVGGYEDHSGDSEKTKCENCGQTIYFMEKIEDVDDLIIENPKSVCPKCALKSEKMPKLMREMLEETVKMYDEKISKD